MVLDDYALIEKSTLTGIGEAIRGKEGTTELIPPGEMKARIEAISGNVEYTTGKVTFAQNNTAKTIQHGLSKAPKVFFLRWDKYKTDYSLYLNAALYTENISSIWCGASAVLTFTGQYTTVPEAYTPGYGAMTADNENVNIAEVAKSWMAGDWTWEAWTW